MNFKNKFRSAILPLAMLAGGSALYSQDYNQNIEANINVHPSRSQSAKPAAPAKPAVKKSTPTSAVAATAILQKPTVGCPDTVKVRTSGTLDAVVLKLDGKTYVGSKTGNEYVFKGNFDGVYSTGKLIATYKGKPAASANVLINCGGKPTYAPSTSKAPIEQNFEQNIFVVTGKSGRQYSVQASQSNGYSNSAPATTNQKNKGTNNTIVSQNKGGQNIKTNTSVPEGTPIKQNYKQNIVKVPLDDVIPPAKNTPPPAKKDDVPPPVSSNDCPTGWNSELKVGFGQLSYSSRVPAGNGTECRFDESYNIVKFGAKINYLTPTDDFSIAGALVSGKGVMVEDSFRNDATISGFSLGADYTKKWGNWSGFGIATQGSAEFKQMEKRVNNYSVEPETTQSYIGGIGLTYGDLNCDNITVLGQYVIQPINYTAAFNNGQIHTEQDTEKFAQFTIKGRKRVLDGRATAEFGLSYAPKISTLSSSEPRTLNGSAFNARLSLTGKHWGGALDYSMNKFDMTSNSGVKLGNATTTGLVLSAKYRF